MFGVCCDHPDMLDMNGNHKEDGTTPPAVIMPPNWPPPLPTHPPDHTVPPVPTYPPSTKPPTLPPWPPQQQQHNFTTVTNRPPTITTMSNVDTDDIDGFQFQCGLKNGPQDQERIVGGQNADPGEWPWIVSTYRDVESRSVKYMVLILYLYTNRRRDVGC